MAIILDTAYHLVWMSDITAIIILLLLLTAQHHCQLLDILCKGELVSEVTFYISHPMQKPVRQ